MFFTILIFFSVVLVLFLEHALIREKHKDLQFYFSSQSHFFKTCISQSALRDVSLYQICYDFSDEVVESDWYFFGPDNELLWTSKNHPQAEIEAPALISAVLAQPSFVRYNHYIHYSTLATGGRTLVMSVPQTWFEQQLVSIRINLAIFSAIMIGLFCAIWFWRLRQGLKPVKHMTLAIEKVANGKENLLQEKYATEFADMQLAVNSLLSSEKNQRERYRNTLADLAHSLKTPLAVLQGALNENLSRGEFMKINREQLRRMDQIIQYQLKRAVNSIGDGAKTSAIPVHPIIERIVFALGKVYREKEVQGIFNLDKKVEIIADERDLMEVLGNILENAYKYCRSEVAASMYEDAENVYIEIEDDGPGVTQDMRCTILERGERADTSAAPGQGIGLSVAVDILSAYNCRLAVQDSLALGGAKFSITFPKT